MRWSYHIIHIVAPNSQLNLGSTHFCMSLYIYLKVSKTLTCEVESEERMTSIVIEKIHQMSVKIFVSYPFLLSSSLSFSCFDNCALSCRSCPSSLALDVSYLRKLCDGKTNLSIDHCLWLNQSLSLIEKTHIMSVTNHLFFIVCYFQTTFLI